MSFTQAIKTCLSKYVVFNGRAMRSEFWYWTLFSFIVSVIISSINYSADSALIAAVVSLINFAIFIPTLAVTVRRLHDIGKSGLWYLICLIPLVGQIILIVFACKDSQPGTNQYGPNPKEMASANTMTF